MSRIVYDYNNTNVYKSQYANSLLNLSVSVSEKYIKMPFINNRNIANPSLIINTDKYKTENIYILNKNHNFKDKKNNTISYDGEFIIEHLPITNGMQPVYFCILLKNTPNIGETVIDKLINQTYTDDLEVNINEILSVIRKPENANNVLINKNNNVIVFLRPYSVRSKFEKFTLKKTLLFPEYIKDDYGKGTVRHVSEPKQLVQESFTEGLEDDIAEETTDEEPNNRPQMEFLDCQLLDVPSDMVTNVTVPLGGESSTIDGKTAFVESSVTFFLSTIFILVTLVVVPFAYKTVLVDPFLNSKSENSHYKFMASLFLMGWMFIAAIVVLLFNENIFFNTMGIYLIIFLCIAIFELFVLTVLYRKDYYIPNNSDNKINLYTYIYNVANGLLINMGFFGMFCINNFLLIMFVFTLFIGLEIGFYFGIGFTWEEISPILTASPGFWIIHFFMIVGILMFLDNTLRQPE